MTLRFYNTQTKQIEEFNSLEAGKVKLYTCGPTVYGPPHIGNLKTMVVFDLVRRYLEYKGYEVNHVLNITDVEDKIIKNCQKEGISRKEFTKKYTEIFFEDLKKLNVKPATNYPRATEYIDEMISLISILLEKEIAYKAEDGVYFSIKKFKEYGKLSGINLTGLEAGRSGRMRSDEYEKDQAQDFVLWKSYVEEDGNIVWDSPFGRGRPGWHTECVAMIKALLGTPIDIHMGAIDLIFPHHENEIAQAEGAYGAPFVQYWLHGGHLMVEGAKMAKSKGNFYTLPDLIEKGISPAVIRYMYLSCHYRQKYNFTFEGAKANEQALLSLYEFVDKLELVNGTGWNDAVLKCDEFIKLFEETMDDDLNVSGALGALHDFVRECNKNMEQMSKSDGRAVITTIKKIDTVFGFLIREKSIIPERVVKMAEERELARGEKNFALSDELRDRMKDEGYYVDDTPNGPIVKKLGL